MKIQRSRTTSIGHEEERLLIEEYKAGSRDAFAKLYLIHRDPLAKYVRRFVTSVDEIEDVVHDTFVRMMKYIHNFDSKRLLSVWLRTIAKHLCMDRRDMASNRMRADCDYHDDISRTQTPGIQVHAEIRGQDAIAEEKQEWDRVRRLLASLSPAHRRVVELRVFEEMTSREVALILGCPKGTAMTRFFNAMKKLRSLIRREALRNAERTHS